MTMKHSPKYMLIIMGLLILIAGYMQYSINQSTKALKNSEITKATQYAERIATYLIKNTSIALTECLEKNPNKRDQLNHILRAFKTEDFKNLFVLEKGTGENFRFLLDSATEESAEFHEPFIPESQEFIHIYNSQKAKIIEQKGSVEEVWLSLLYPIRRNNKTEGLLVMDLSESYGNHIKNFNSPIHNTVLLLQAFTLLSILFLAYSLYSSYKMRKEILIDPLTGAYTKIYRREFFEEENINNHDLILMDIDKFRRINDRVGRENANNILKEYIDHIKTLLPDKAKIVRNDGAEFLIILPKSELSLPSFAQSLYDNIQTKRYLKDDNVITLSITMCAAVTSEKIDTFYEMEHILDSKLLEIKSRGKEHLSILNDISNEDIKYKNIDNIKSAIDKKQLTCIYQPIYHTKSKKIVKYEALVRIIDKDSNKLIPPYYFIDMIKESVYYIRLSKVVINSAFELLKQYPSAEISINIDLVDLYNEEMMALIRQELFHNKDLANRLTFEILEHHEITNFDRVDFIFKQLRSYGSQIAIDDFGSGYANFTYLAKLDIDILKIDASLVLALEDHHNERAKSIIKLIKDLGEANKIKVIAEHVSSERIKMILEEIGIEYLQGFHIGKPQPWEYYHPSV